MVLFVRFWNGNEKCVKVRYYGPTFHGYGRLTCWITLLEWKKTSNLNVYTKSLDGPTVNTNVFQELLKNSRMIIFIHLLILVVALSTLCMELFEPVLKNLNGSWKNFWNVHTWFSTAPHQEEKIIKESQDLQPILAVFAQHGMNCLFALSLLYFKNVLLYVFS